MMGTSPYFGRVLLRDTAASVTYTAVGVKYVECCGSNKIEIAYALSLNYIH